jgi:DNA repair exonuclease SbcCD ATPase subunit
MSAELSFLTMDTTALQETVGHMCAGHDRLGTFLRSLFGDLDALADEMMRHGRRIDSAKQDQDTLCSEREERHGRQRQELESTIERLQELTDQLGSSAVASSGDSEQLREVFAGIKEERSTLENALAASESHGTELARMADELAAARQDLTETREELRSQRELLTQVPAQEERSAAASESHGAELARMADELAAARQDLTETREELRDQRELLSQLPSPSESAATPEIHDRLDQIEQERLAWTQQRAVLETELDTVRDRAAELVDTLDEERQRASSERKDWAEELRQMRQLLQSLSERKAVAVPDVVAPASVKVESTEEDAQDPVLDSVMAQFEILQKDLARRRKAKPASK